jgi:hypothetical protein
MRDETESSFPSMELRWLPWSLNMERALAPKLSESVEKQKKPHVDEKLMLLLVLLLPGGKFHGMMATLSSIPICLHL